MSWHLITNSTKYMDERLECCRNGQSKRVGDIPIIYAELLICKVAVQTSAQEDEEDRTGRGGL